MSGFLDRGSQRHTYFLGINGDGNLYERSNEPKGGFVPHVNPMTGQPSGYWKEHPGGFCAYLNYIGIKTITNSKGSTMDYFIMTFRDYSSENDFLVMIPMRTQKGGLHRYVKSFVKYYKNIDISRELIFNAFKRKKDDDFAPSNLVFAYEKEDGKTEMVPLYFKKGQNGWVEAEKHKSYDGREVSNTDKQDGFVYERLKEYIADFNNKIKDVRVAILKDRMAKGLPLYGQASASSMAEPQGKPMSPEYQKPTPPPAYTQNTQVSAPPSFPQPEEVGTQTPPPPIAAPTFPNFDDDLPF